MIETKQQLFEYLKEEKALYLPDSRWKRLFMRIIKDPNELTYRYVESLRKKEYYHGLNRKGKAVLRYIYYTRKKNILGRKLGIKMDDGVFESGLVIFHSQGIVVNGYAKVGKNCKLHGNNCIGNDGKTYDAPILGDDIDVGYGACIIGKVTLADHIKIGAGAVVIESCYEEGATLAGVPAVCKKKKIIQIDKKRVSF